jgi:hypothetical protein
MAMAWAGAAVSAVTPTADSSSECRTVEIPFCDCSFFTKHLFDCPSVRVGALIDGMLGQVPAGTALPFAKRLSTIRNGFETWLRRDRKAPVPVSLVCETGRFGRLRPYRLGDLWIKFHRHSPYLGEHDPWRGRLSIVRFSRC